MNLLNEEDYINLLAGTKEAFNIRKENRDIDENKAKKIFRQVNENEKVSNFLTGRFLEQYVKAIYENREKIKKNVRPNNGGDIHQNNYYINLPVEEFEKILAKITIENEHLSDDEIQDTCQMYQQVLKDKVIHNTFSHIILKRYAQFIYANRYQIRVLLNKRITQMKKDENGDYILKDGTFIAKVNRDGGKNSPIWICMKMPEELANNEINPEETEKSEDAVNKKDNKNFIWDLVVKNLFDENERETALIAEEIARQLGLPVAQYYPARYVGKEYSKEGMEEKNKNNASLGRAQTISESNYVTERIVITPNFLKPGEELVTGDRIARYEMDVTLVPNTIKEYFEKQGLSNEQIDGLISDYKIIMAFNCFINHRDGHNGNWGYIKDKDGNYRMSHIFDLEGSLDENSMKIRAIYMENIFSGMGENIDGELLKYLLQDDKCRQRVKKFYKLDLDAVFTNVYLSKGVQISTKKQQAVRQVINEEKAILQRAVREVEANCR